MITLPSGLARRAPVSDSGPQPDHVVQRLGRRPLKAVSPSESVGNAR